MKTLTKKTEIPGPLSSSLFERERKFLAPGLQAFALMSGIVMEKGKGSYLYDVDGNEYIDIIGGIGVNSLGHSHPRYVHAMQEQIAKLSVGSFSTEIRTKFTEKFSSIGSASLKKVQLYSSGAEAVESALRLAKCYTKKHGFLSFTGAFHGKTLGAMGLLGFSEKEAYAPFPPGLYLAPYPDSYRCPLGTQSGEASRDACLEELRTQMKKIGFSLAAIIVEPMQGTSGNRIPPKGFLSGLREICDEFDCLLIGDEMITGFGRLGHWFASSIENVEPDIITLGKGFAGGFPLSALTAKDFILEAKPWSNPSGSSSSYGGNPMGAMAAYTTISIMQEENLLENSRNMGSYFLTKLKEMQEEFPFIGHVRGEGLFLGLEIVKNRKTKEPVSEEIMKEMFMDGIKKGLLVMSYKPSIRIQPALTINKDSIDLACSLLREIFSSDKWKHVYSE